MTEVVAYERGPIAAEWLPERLFTFRAGAEQNIMTRTMRFERNGRISGYNHPNETGWKLEDGNLVILRDDGAPSCIAKPSWNDDKTVSFSGTYLFDDFGSIHRFDEVRAMSDLPLVSTFDLFDTLIARRCYEPLKIFSLVEAKSRIPDFAKFRRDAEVSIWHADDYGFDDIYTTLGHMTGWSNDVLSKLKMLELAEEWDHLFPIEEMVTRVGPHDMIITDMYLPMTFVRKLVDEKCKLSGRTIHLSAHGKSRGGVWPKIHATHRILRHHGDNWGSDVTSASQAGVEPQHITISGWNRSEKILIEADLIEFAEIVREVRLATFHPDILIHGALRAQIEINIPTLLLASLDILRRSREHNIDTLLMCSRDCNLWVNLMRWLAARSEIAPQVKYFTSSRVLLLSDSAEYSAYFARVSGKRNMIIDVSGTGRSPSHFIGYLGEQENSIVYMVTAKKAESWNFVNVMAVVHDDVDLHILCEQPFEARFTLECLNVSLDGRAHEMVFNGHTLEVIADINEFGPDATEMIKAMRGLFMNFMARLDSSTIRKIPEHLTQTILQDAAMSITDDAHNYLKYLQPIQADIWKEEPYIAAVAMSQPNRRRA